jgi:hypothetical protein
MIVEGGWCQVTSRSDVSHGRASEAALVEQANSLFLY